MGLPCLGFNGGPAFQHSEAFSFQVVTADPAETNRYWNAIVGHGGEESACGWCKDQWGWSWQIIPRALTEAISDRDLAAAQRAFEAMMSMGKIDVSTIEAARRGCDPRLAVLQRLFWLQELSSAAQGSAQLLIDQDRCVGTPQRSCCLRSRVFACPSGAASAINLDRVSTMSISRLLLSLCSDRLSESRDFYVSLLGFEVAYDSDWFVQLRCPTNHDLQLGILSRTSELVPAGHQQLPAGMVLTLVVPDVDAVYRQAQALGLAIVQEPKNEFYGQRRFLTLDPNGCLVDVCSPWSGNEP